MPSIRAVDVRVATALALALALAPGCKKDQREKKVKDEWETGKFVPPPEKTEKLEPLPRFTCKVVGQEKWRFDPVAALLAGGQVLVAGGRARKKWLTSTAIVDPTTGKSKPAAGMKQTRALHTTVTLADGRVLVVGGGSRELELFNPKTRSWRVVGRLKKEAVRVAAAQLPGGEVYIAGGDLTGTRALCRDAYLWDPKTGRLKPLPALKKGVKGRAFSGPEGKVVLLAKLSGEDRASLLVTNPQQGTVEPFESDEILWKALRELGRSKGGDDVSLAYTAAGKPVMPPTGLRGDALLRFFPSRLSWRTLAKLLRDHTGGVPVALSPGRIAVFGGRPEESKVVEVCTAP